MNKTPKVTVLMPVYNAEKYLKEAIDSILNQTFKDFEFLIINDGSIDKSVDIIESYNDFRIKLIHNDQNRGIIHTLNKGLELAQGKYIARMDADDISLPNRLDKQVDFMEQNKEIGIAGTYIRVFNGKFSYKGQKLFTKSKKIKEGLMFRNLLMHPSIVMRKSMLEEYSLKYNKRHKHLEDYGLWVEASNHMKLANIPKHLLKYRNNPNSITKLADKKKKERIYYHSIIFSNILKYNDINFNGEELNFHTRGFVYGAEDLNDIFKMKRWLNELKKRNHKISDEVLNDAFFQFCYKSCRNGLKTFWYYLKLKNEDNYRDKIDLFKFLLKCILRR